MLITNCHTMSNKKLTPYSSSIAKVYTEIDTVIQNYNNGGDIDKLKHYVDAKITYACKLGLIGVFEKFESCGVFAEDHPLQLHVYSVLEAGSIAIRYGRRDVFVYLTNMIQFRDAHVLERSNCMRSWFITAACMHTVEGIPIIQHLTEMCTLEYSNVLIEAMVKIVEEMFKPQNTARMQAGNAHLTIANIMTDAITRTILLRDQPSSALYALNPVIRVLNKMSDAHIGILMTKFAYDGPLGRDMFRLLKQPEIRQYNVRTHYVRVNNALLVHFPNGVHNIILLYISDF